MRALLLASSGKLAHYVVMFDTGEISWVAAWTSDGARVAFLQKSGQKYRLMPATVKQDPV